MEESASHHVHTLKAERCVLEVHGAEEIERPPPSKRKKAAQDTGDAGDSIDGQTEFCAQWANDSEGFSTNPSVCSGEESCQSDNSQHGDASGEPNDADGLSDSDLSQEDALHALRAPSGSYVVYSHRDQEYTNLYFTFQNHPGFNDLKVRVRPPWCRDGLLGRTNMSKAVRPADVGASKEDPHVCLLVLKS